VFFIGTLVATWTSAAFAEEMIFRGYLMNRLAGLFGHNFFGWSISLVVQAVVLPPVTAIRVSQVYSEQERAVFCWDYSISAQSAICGPVL
jgi:membrane protease YdiL (CAAX protease family)